MLMTAQARMRLFHLLHLFLIYLYIFFYIALHSHTNVCEWYANRMRFAYVCIPYVQMAFGSKEIIREHTKKATDKRVAHRRSLPENRISTIIHLPIGALPMYLTQTMQN